MSAPIGKKKMEPCVSTVLVVEPVFSETFLSLLQCCQQSQPTKQKKKKSTTKLTVDSVIVSVTCYSAISQSSISTAFRQYSTCLDWWSGIHKWRCHQQPLNHHHHHQPNHHHQVLHTVWLPTIQCTLHLDQFVCSVRSVLVVRFFFLVRRCIFLSPFISQPHCVAGNAKSALYTEKKTPRSSHPLPQTKKGLYNFAYKRLGFTALHSSSSYGADTKPNRAFPFPTILLPPNLTSTKSSLSLSLPHTHCAPIIPFVFSCVWLCEWWYSCCSRRIPTLPCTSINWSSIDIFGACLSLSLSLSLSQCVPVSTDAIYWRSPLSYSLISRLSLSPFSPHAFLRSLSLPRSCLFLFCFSSFCFVSILCAVAIFIQCLNPVCACLPGSLWLLLFWNLYQPFWIIFSGCRCCCSCLLLFGNITRTPGIDPFSVCVWRFW